MMYFGDLVLKNIIPGLYIVAACRFDNSLKGKVYGINDVKNTYKSGHTIEII